MFCAGCGNPIPVDASFCTVCGRPVDRRFIPYAPVTPASQVSPIYSGNPATPAAQTTLLRQPDYGARKTAFLFIFYIFMIVPIVELIVAQKVWNKTSVQLAYKIYQMQLNGRTQLGTLFQQHKDHKAQSRKIANRLISVGKVDKLFMQTSR